MNFILNSFISHIWIIGTFFGLMLYGYKSRTESVDPVVAFLVSLFLSWFFVFWAFGQIIWDLNNKK